MILDILDRITMLLNGKDQKELTEYLGLKNVAFSEWKSGKSKSYRKYLIEIANFFDVSLDYLVYGKVTPNQLPIENAKMLSIFNQLKPADKVRVMERAETLAELAAERAAKERAAEQAKETSKPVELAAGEKPVLDESDQATRKKHTIAYYDYPASAGTGLFLGEAIAKKICVFATLKARYADFAIPINGDSMEPDYSDGDIVLVKSSPNIPEGQVGIFVLDGDVYIKEYGGKRLISRNSEYPPIMLKNYETAICLGRVIGKAEIIK